MFRLEEFGFLLVKPHLIESRVAFKRDERLDILGEKVKIEYSFRKLSDSCNLTNFLMNLKLVELNEFSDAK